MSRNPAQGSTGIALGTEYGWPILATLFSGMKICHMTILAPRRLPLTIVDTFHPPLLIAVVHVGILHHSLWLVQCLDRAIQIKIPDSAAGAESV